MNRVLLSKHHRCTVYVSFCRNNGEEEDVNVNSVVVNYKIVVSSLFLI